MGRFVLAAVVGLVAMVGLFVWHAAAVGQINCNYECIPNNVCEGSTTIQCGGCAAFELVCGTQAGKREWSSAATFGSSFPGPYRVEYVSVLCYTDYPCVRRYIGPYRCLSTFGICDLTQHYYNENCYDCGISEVGYPSMYVTAICKSCDE